MSGLPSRHTLVAGVDVDAPARDTTPRPERPEEFSRRARRVKQQRRRRIRRGVALLLLVVLAPAVYSYTSTMLQPSSLPLGVRSVEWLRAHWGAWLVNDVEKVYYSAKAPSPGGSQLHTLPTVGRLPAARPKVAVYRPARVRSPLVSRLAGGGGWRATGPSGRGVAPGLVDALRPHPWVSSSGEYVG